MRVVQTVFGVFHHFELARELERRGHLERIYSTWPWMRVKRESLPKDRVRTFPLIHTAEMLLNRSPLRSAWATDQLGYANALTFDAWTARQLATTSTPPDALIAISGSSLRTGTELQARGGVFICDRGSSHQRYQTALLEEEYRRWGARGQVSDPRDTIREEKIYSKADAITVPSAFARRSFLEMGVPGEKVHRIPYGVRLEAFRRTEPPPRISERLEVIFAGQVSLRKGVPYLLQAFARVRHPRKRLRVVGAMQPEMKEVLRRLPLDSVEFVGAVPQSELARMMGASHALVLPSIEEGLALVMGQALACGCPVIASTNSGGEDLFTDGVEGWIVPIRDPGAIAERLERLVQPPGLQEQLSAAALDRVQRLGGWRQYGDEWEALLHRLTGK